MHGSLAVIWFGLSYIRWKKSRFLKCGKWRYEVCYDVTDTSTFSGTVTGDTFKINHSLNCDDTCFIYLMTSKQCNKQYTGETTDLFRSRWNSYKDNTRKFDRKESCLQDTYANIFRGRVTKASWMRRQLDVLLKLMKKTRKKEKGIGCEHWKQWNLMGLMLQMVHSRVIFYFTCLLIIIFSPLLLL